MARLLFSACLFFYASALLGQNGETSLYRTPKLLCTLTSDKAIYKIGELPQFQVRIQNNTDKEIYLIGALEKSDTKRRYPYCYFSIEKPMPDSIEPAAMCGFANPLRENEFRIIKPNESFNPYESIDNYGFWPDYLTSQKTTFRNPGCYKIQFHYSTLSSDISCYIGSKEFDKTKDSALVTLLNKVLKAELSSNEIDIFVRK